MRPAAASHDNRSWPDSIHSNGVSTGVATELRKSRARASAMRNGERRLSVANSNLVFLLPSAAMPQSTRAIDNRYTAHLLVSDLSRGRCARCAPPRDDAQESDVHQEASKAIPCLHP